MQQIVNTRFARKAVVRKYYPGPVGRYVTPYFAIRAL
jgi:hypothetical protein